MKKATSKRVRAVAAAAVCAAVLPVQLGFSASAASEYSVKTETAGNGSAYVSAEKNAPGSSVTVSATPDPGYEFDHWEITSIYDGGFEKQANLVFVIDTTGSMYSEIEDVKNNVEAMAADLNKKGVGLNMALIEYRDIFVDGDDSTKYYTFSDGTHWTTKVDEIETTLDKMKCGGGGDTPETPTDAFGKMLLADGTLDFPDDTSNNFLFLLTDAGYKDFEDTAAEHAKGHYSMNEWIKKFNDENVKVSVVTTNSNKSKYEDLFTKTKGTFININSDDYYKLMVDFSKFIDEESESIKIVSSENPYSFTMPNANVTAKAFFREAAKSAYTITVKTNGGGTAYASASTAYGGEKIYITAKPKKGYTLKSIECVEGGAVITNNSFFMPKANVVIYVMFEEDISELYYTARPYSYVFTYDSEMNLVDTFSNRNFDNYPEYVSIKINLGEEYAGKTGNICAGRKSDSKVIETVTLDDNGCYVFKADIKKNYSFVLAD